MKENRSLQKRLRNVHIRNAALYKGPILQIELQTIEEKERKLPFRLEKQKETFAEFANLPQSQLSCDLVQLNSF